MRRPVEIRAVAREPGWRSKIAVISHVQGVDPVGACVGPRGSRVRMVVSELRGEKIDIIPFNEEPARYVAKALSPARVREVLVDDDGRQATVIVPDDQLSLSIGREGMNARLAARLTGWHIDIQSESQYAEAEAEAAYVGGGTDEEYTAAARRPLDGQALPQRPLPGSRYLRHPRSPRARGTGGRAAVASGASQDVRGLWPEGAEAGACALRRPRGPARGGPSGAAPGRGYTCRRAAYRAGGRRRAFARTLRQPVQVPADSQAVWWQG